MLGRCSLHFERTSVVGHAGIMIGEAVFSIFQLVIAAVPLKYAYGLVGLIVGLVLGLGAGSLG